MSVSLPERTVDAWVTAYVAKRSPDALIWAPTQRDTPDYDIASSLPGPGKLFVLEDKAPYANGHHHFRLEVRQMWNYLLHPQLRTRAFYVLPCPPFPVTDVPGASSWANVDLVPRQARSRIPAHPWPRSQPCEEWFRVVPVLDLWTHLLKVAPPESDITRKPWPAKGSAPPDAPKVAKKPTLQCPLPADLGESLKSFMDGLFACDRPELRITPELGVNIGRIENDGKRRRSRRRRGRPMDSPLYRALITFIPASQIPGWH